MSAIAEFLVSISLQSLRRYFVFTRATRSVALYATATRLAGWLGVFRGVRVEHFSYPTRNHTRWCLPIYPYSTRDRKAKQNDKNQTFLNTILTTGISRKLMTSLVWWILLLLLVPWSAWTVGASHGVSIWFCRRLLMPHLSDLCHTTSKWHQSMFVQVVPDDAHPRPFQTNYYY